MEFFQHKQEQAAQYGVCPGLALSPLVLGGKHWPAPGKGKPSLRLAFQQARRELEQIQRLREVCVCVCVWDTDMTEWCI